jgi:hypothetical protein
MSGKNGNVWVSNSSKTLLVFFLVSIHFKNVHLWVSNISCQNVFLGDMAGIWQGSNLSDWDDLQDP